MPSHSVSKKSLFFSVFAFNSYVISISAIQQTAVHARYGCAGCAGFFGNGNICIALFEHSRHRVTLRHGLPLIYMSKKVKEPLAILIVFKPRHRREQPIHRLALNLAFVHLRPLRQQNIIHPYYIMPCRPSRIFQALLMCFCQTYIRPCLFPLSCRRIGTLFCPPRFWQRPSRA